MRVKCLYCEKEKSANIVDTSNCEGRGFRESHVYLEIGPRNQQEPTSPYDTRGKLLSENMPISVMQARIHVQNRNMGWWDNPREMGTLLCLVHSEISEAMEGERKNLMDDHLPHRSMLEVELADAMIRIMDIAASRGLDLAGAIVEKVDYNSKRADHQPGARAGTYGKKF